MRPPTSTPAAERFCRALDELLAARQRRRAHRHPLPSCGDCVEIQEAEARAYRDGRAAVREVFASHNGRHQHGVV